MARSWPALDVHGVENGDLVLVVLDDFQPTAIEERRSSLRAFFSSAVTRDGARAALAPQYAVQPIDVPDEDWATRSQEGLPPVSVGRITILPRADVTTPHRAKDTIRIVIPSSMAFGTGHHATTRLCLDALQSVDLAGATVVDAGTGSGILAIAAARLGAHDAIGIDDDPHALDAANANLLLNPDARRVTFRVGDLGSMPLPPADVVTANLTGALVSRLAAALGASVRENGTVIVSGILAHERADVLAAFAAASMQPVSETTEDEWLCLKVRHKRMRS